MTPSKRLRPRRKYFTVAEANAMLPLLRSILRDVTALAQSLNERQNLLERVDLSSGGRLPDAHLEELQRVRETLERDQERMHEYESELKKLGVELKDYLTGLIDFYSLRDGREIYLCWKLGEPEVSHWHELDAGFAGRQKLAPEKLYR
jgi:hypothetical protein